MWFEYETCKRIDWRRKENNKLNMKRHFYSYDVVNFFKFLFSFVRWSAGWFLCWLFCFVSAHCFWMFNICYVIHVTGCISTPLSIHWFFFFHFISILCDRLRQNNEIWIPFLSFSLSLSDRPGQTISFTITYICVVNVCKIIMMNVPPVFLVAIAAIIPLFILFVTTRVPTLFRLTIPWLSGRQIFQIHINTKCDRFRKTKLSQHVWWKPINIKINTILSKTKTQQIHWQKISSPITRLSGFSHLQNYAWKIRNHTKCC